jgi:hypothetical protein
LWLACSPENEQRVITAIFPVARRQLANRRRMLLDYQDGRANQALNEVGFHIQQTLIWMRLE